MVIQNMDIIGILNYCIYIIRHGCQENNVGSEMVASELNFIKTQNKVCGSGRLEHQFVLQTHASRDSSSMLASNTL